jgi:hypothetical protein
MQPTKRLKPVTVTVTAAASYEDEAAVVGHHGDNSIAATSLLRHVADEVAPPSCGQTAVALFVHHPRDAAPAHQRKMTAAAAGSIILPHRHLRSEYEGRRRLVCRQKDLAAMAGANINEQRQANHQLID